MSASNVSSVLVPKKLQVRIPTNFSNNKNDNNDLEISENVQKMLNGELYDAMTLELREARAFAKIMCQKINLASPLDEPGRQSMFAELLGCYSKGCYIEPPFYCDYGSNIFLGEGVYMNHNCVLLDCAPILMGKHVFLAPNVQIYTATHPTDPILRRTVENTKPVIIGNDVWIGGGAIILPGITIGDGSTVGAGAVVTKDVPPYVVVAGNPARVIRTLEKPVEI